MVERNHRTVKRVAARSKISPLKAVFWYNLSPKDGRSEKSVPSSEVFSYEWRSPNIAPKPPSKESSIFDVGETVWVKPPNARCTTKWNTGKVTNVLSRNNVEVDGCSRHVLDIRKFVEPSDSDAYDTAEEEISESDSEVDNHSVDLSGIGELFETNVPKRQSMRERRPPVWLKNYETNFDDCN